MQLRKPESMEECYYFTNRDIGEGRVTAWVFKKHCQKCDGLMGKPLKKSGKVDKSSLFYACCKCSHQESNENIENDLILNVEYKCPHCLNEGQTTTEYKRESFKGIPSYVFSCEKCGEKIPITKKLREKKSGFNYGD